MSNLYGWDTVSVIAIDLVNAALAKSANQLITEFDFHGDDLSLTGTFGTWSVAPGGTLQRLQLILPIRFGKIEGWVGEVDLSGITLTVRVLLRLLDAPAASDAQHLVFDLEESFKDGGEDAVEPVLIDDPEGRLSPTQETGLKLAVAACLSAHSDQVSFVFASVKARGTVQTDALATAHHDWMLLNTTAGQQYLAIVGAMKRPAAANSIDTALVAEAPSAVLAISNALLTNRFLLPAMQRDFRPAASFKVDKSAVVNVRDIPLPTLKKGMVNIHPRITLLRLSLGNGALVCKARVNAPLTLLAKFYTEVDMNMPVEFDTKTRKIRVLPDPSPKETHTVKFPKVIDFLIGWLVRWIVSFFDKAISEAVLGVATHFERFNSPTIDTVRWSGIRDFETSGIALDGNMVLFDSRPPK